MSPLKQSSPQKLSDSIHKYSQEILQLAQVDQVTVEVTKSVTQPVQATDEEMEISPVRRQSAVLKAKAEMNRQDEELNKLVEDVYGDI